MLKFFYCFLKKYISKRCFKLLESDTGSMHFTISHHFLDDCVPNHLKKNISEPDFVGCRQKLVHNTKSVTFNKEPLVEFVKTKNVVKSIIK